MQARNIAIKDKTYYTLNGKKIDTWLKMERVATKFAR